MKKLIPCLAFLLIAADWAQFRGPTQQGHSDAKNLPIEWSPEKNVKWKIVVPGLGWSSPVIVKDVIYLTTAVEVEKDVSLRVLALNAANGETIWNQEIRKLTNKDVPRSHSKNSNASPTAIVENDLVYVHFGHLGTACLKAKSGEIAWSNFELGYKPVHGNGGSPTLHDGKMIFSIDGIDRQEVVALNAKDGQLAWRTKRNTKPGRPFSFSTPTVIELHGKTQLISQGSDVVMSLNPKTGEEFWRFGYEGYSVVPRPVFADGMLYCCTSYDTSKLLAIKPSDQSGELKPADLLWSTDKNVPHNPSLIYHDGLLYGVSDKGVANCWDAKTGKVYWSERVGNAYSSSILHAGDKLYLQSEDGEGTVLKVGKTFELIKSNKLKERSLASYGVAGNALIIRTEKHLYRIEQ